ncbi:MAG: hypothetical protein WAL71_09215 [Terriglobales bacterium]
MDNLLGIWHRTRGGQSTSPAKRKAARINGRKSADAPNNGRPAGVHQRTLLEFLLRKQAGTLTKEDHKHARFGIYRMADLSGSKNTRNRQMFFDRFVAFYGLPTNIQAQDMLERKNYTIRRVRQGDWTDMPAILKTFRTWARWGITNRK